jgi:hypothetical protein
MFTADENTDIVVRPFRSWRPITVVAFALTAVSAGALTTAVLVTLRPQPGAPPRPALDATASALSRAIDDGARKADKLAADIAAAPQVRAAILTDPATVADMVRTEFPFKLAAGDAFELYQLDGARAKLLARMPAGAPVIGLVGAPRTELASDRDGLRIHVEVPVQRIRDGTGYKTRITGVLSLSVPVDLSAIKLELAQHAVRATVTGLGAPVVLLDRAGTNTGDTIEVPVTLDALHAPALALAVASRAAPVRSRHTAMAAFSLALLFGLGGAIVSRRAARRPRRASKGAP